MMISLDFQEWLRVDAVLTCAKRWVDYQGDDSQKDQKTDARLAREAREAARDLVVAVEFLRRETNR